MDTQPDHIVTAIIEFAGAESLTAIMQVSKRMNKLADALAEKITRLWRENNAQCRANHLRLPMWKYIAGRCKISIYAIANIDLQQISQYNLRAIIRQWAGQRLCKCALRAPYFMKHFMFQPKSALIVLDELIATGNSLPDCRKKITWTVGVKQPRQIWQLLAVVANDLPDYNGILPAESFVSLTIFLIKVGSISIKLKHILEQLIDRDIRELVIAFVCFAMPGVEFGKFEMEIFCKFAAATNCRYPNTLKVIGDFVNYNRKPRVKC